LPVGRDDGTMAAFPEHSRSNEVTPVTVAPEIHRFTVDEYDHIVRDLGWDATELIEGVVYDVTPEHNRHAGTVDHVFRSVDAWFTGHWTRFSGSVRLSDRSLVAPDIFVIDRSVPLDPDGSVPVAAVHLVIEVSVTTHDHDHGPKLAAYAMAGVPEVWLIDPRPGAGVLVRHRQPDGTTYAAIDRFDVGEDAAHLDLATVTAD
jgi:Uma2 family endonuclease